MYSAFIIHFATDVLAQGQQQKPKKCIHIMGKSCITHDKEYTIIPIV